MGSSELVEPACPCEHKTHTHTHTTSAHINAHSGTPPACQGTRGTPPRALGGAELTCLLAGPFGSSKASSDDQSSANRRVAANVSEGRLSKRGLSDGGLGEGGLSARGRAHLLSDGSSQRAVKHCP